MKVPTKKAQKIWDRMNDNSLQEERIILDKLIEVRPDMAPLKITSRDGPGIGQFSTVTTLGKNVGCYVMDLVWIRAEIRRCRCELTKTKKREASYCVGAYI